MKSSNEWDQRENEVFLVGNGQLINTINEMSPNMSCYRPWAMWCGIYARPVEARSFP